MSEGTGPEDEEQPAGREPENPEEVLQPSDHEPDDLELGEIQPRQLIFEHENFWDPANISEFEQVAEKEGQQFAADARRTKAETAALLKYVDPAMVDPDFVMPVFDDPHDAVTYIAGLVELRRTAQDTRHRQTLIRRVTYFTVGWILAVLAILGLDGAKAIAFHLPEAVTVTLVGTTTANVLGLAVIVLRGMFHQQPRDHVRAPEAVDPPKT